VETREGDLIEQAILRQIALLWQTALPRMPIPAPTGL